MTHTTMGGEAAATGPLSRRRHRSMGLSTPQPQNWQEVEQDTPLRLSDAL